MVLLRLAVVVRGAGSGGDDGAVLVSLLSAGRGGEGEGRDPAAAAGMSALLVGCVVRAGMMAGGERGRCWFSVLKDAGGCLLLKRVLAVLVQRSRLPSHCGGRLLRPSKIEKGCSPGLVSWWFSFVVSGDGDVGAVVLCRISLLACAAYGRVSVLCC